MLSLVYGFYFYFILIPNVIPTANEISREIYTVLQTVDVQGWSIVGENLTWILA